MLTGVVSVCRWAENRESISLRLDGVSILYMYSARRLRRRRRGADGERKVVWIEV